MAIRSKMYNRCMKGFIEFIRKQGVVGLAVGFILGGAISKTVSSFVSDVVNPLIGKLLGSAEALQAKTVYLGTIPVKWGSFASNVVDFIVIAFVVYFGVKTLGLDKLDLKKDEKSEK